MPADLVELLPSARLSKCLHSFERPVYFSSLFFQPAYLFSRFDHVRTLRPKHSRKRIDFDLRFAIMILFGHAHKVVYSGKREQKEQNKGKRRKDEPSCGGRRKRQDYLSQIL